MSNTARRTTTLDTMATRVEHEEIKFDVEHWWLDYSILVNNAWRPGDVLGRCSETRQVKVSGPLRSRTRRTRAARVLLTIDAGGADPTKWREEWKCVGYVQGVRRGAIWATVYLQLESFNMLLTALGARQVRRLYIGADRSERRGQARITFFKTIDPEEDDEDE
jgi:hypothetical protein